MVKIKGLSFTHLSLIFNDEVFGMEDINKAWVCERAFFLELCSNFWFLIFIEFMIIVG